MKRRTVLGTFGALSGSSALAIGSGAFSFVRTEREFTVKVENDNEAYLGLRQLGAGGRSVEVATPEEVRFELPGVFEGSDGEGLGPDSIYEFDRDAEEDEEDTVGLLRIQNKGTNDVAVYSEHETTSPLEIELFDITNSKRTPLREDPEELSPGEHVDVGFRVKTFDAELDNYVETLTIIGETIES